MLDLMIKDRSEGMRVEPWRRQNVGAALALEQEGEPQGDVGSVRRVERLQRALYYYQLQPMYNGCLMCGGVEAGQTHSKQLKSFKSLAGNDGHKLHFTQERNLGGREPRRKRQCHSCDASSRGRGRNMLFNL